MNINYSFSIYDSKAEEIPDSKGGKTERISVNRIKNINNDIYNFAVSGSKPIFSSYWAKMEYNGREFWVNRESVRKRLTHGGANEADIKGALKSGQFQQLLNLVPVEPLPSIFSITEAPKQQQGSSSATSPSKTASPPSAQHVVFSTTADGSQGSNLESSPPKLRTEDEKSQTTAPHTRVRRGTAGLTSPSTIASPPPASVTLTQPKSKLKSDKPAQLSTTAKPVDFGLIGSGNRADVFFSMLKAEFEQKLKDLSKAQRAYALTGFDEITTQGTIATGMRALASGIDQQPKEKIPEIITQMAEAIYQELIKEIRVKRIK